MNSFISFLQGLIRPIKPLVIVKPWEQGLRVRFGKHVRLLGPGVHWKIPFFDAVSVLPIRVRATNLPTQTVSTLDGHALTIGLAMQYQIEDVEKVYRSVHNPEQTLASWVLGAVAEHARTLHDDEITSEALRQSTAGLNVAAMGLGAFRVFVTDIAIVRTYRLIQDGRWGNSDSIDGMGREA